MRNLAVAVFFALHGLVHAGYIAISNGLVESQDAVGWNGQSWLLSAVLPEQTILTLASVTYAIVTLGFVVSAVGFYSQRPWTNRALITTAILSILVLITLWDGSFDRLVDKGVLGVLINIAILGYFIQ